MSQSWIIYVMNWTEAFHSTQPTELHIPTTPWKSHTTKTWLSLICPDVGKSAKNNLYWLCQRQLLEAPCLFVNITAKMKAKFFYTKELEYRMLSIPLNHLELFNHNSNASEISLTNCYLFIAKVFFPAKYLNKYRSLTHHWSTSEPFKWLLLYVTTIN